MNNYFSDIRCVNLARRPDKWAECEKEFAKYSLTVERFEAVDGREVEHDPKILDGTIGNILSHMAIIEDAKAAGHNSVLILEDDVEFCEDFNNIFNEWIKEVPEDWELLYLGGNHNAQKKIMVSPHVRSINNTYATHAYAIRHTVYDRVLAKLGEKRCEGDVMLAELQKECKAYCFSPNIAWQRPGISDVFNRFVDYSFLRKGNNTSRDV